MAFSSFSTMNQMLTKPKQVSTSTNTFTNTTFSGMSLWLDAADPLNTGSALANNTAITTWYDKSGAGRNYTQSTAASKPNYTTMTNGKYGLNFASSKFMTTSSNYFSPAKYTIFAIGYSSNAGFSRILQQDYYLLFGANSGLFLNSVGNSASNNWNDLTNTGTSVSGISLMVGTNNNTGSGVLSYVNGASAGAAKNGSTSTNFTNPTIGYLPGNGGSQYWNGFIAELIVYNSVLTTPQRQFVEGYLSWKWALQSNLPILHPYYSVAPTTYIAPSSNLFLYLRLNNDFYDYSNGTATFTPTNFTYSNTLSTPSNIGRYYLYNSVSSTTTFPKLTSSSIAIPQNGISIACWVYQISNSGGAYRPIFWFSGNSGNRFVLFMVGTTPKFDISIGGGETITTSTYSFNTWYHVVWTISSTGIWNLYVNGSTTSISNYSGNYPDTIMNNANNDFFSEGGGSTNIFQGGLCEFQMYNIVLTQAQAATLYNSGNGNLTPGF